MTSHARISIAILRSAGAAQEICIAGAGFTADASGALYLDSESLIVVADLHLEKGSSYARRRVLTKISAVFAVLIES